MASTKIHPSRVLTIILILMHVDNSKSCTTSKVTLQNIQLVPVARGTFYKNSTLYPIAIKISITRIPISFFANVEKYLKKYETYTEPIIKNQVLNAKWTIRNLESIFNGMKFPPKIVSNNNISANILEYKILSKDFQEAALAPTNSILSTPIPPEAPKALTVLNRAVTELNLLHDKILLEQGKYNAVITGKLTQTMLKLLLQSPNKNIDLDAYMAIGIEFITLIYKDEYLAIYNVFLLNNPTGISQFKSIPFKKYNLAHDKFFLYEGQGVKFRTGIPMNLLTMTVIYDKNQLEEIRNPNTLKKYLVKYKPTFFSQEKTGEISIDPNLFDNEGHETFDNGGHETYAPGQNIIANYTLRMGKSFMKFLLRKSGITFFDRKKFSDEDLTNHLDNFLSFLPNYWGYLVGFILAIVITILGGTYIICKKKHFNNKIKKREKEDMRSIALLNQGPLPKVSSSKNSEKESA